MKIYQLQVVNLEDVEYALRVAAKCIAYGFRVDLKPMNHPGTLIINTWCDSEDSYAGLVRQLFLEISDYDSH